VLARSNEVDWRLSWRVEEFWLRGPPPVATIDISVSVQSLGAEDRLWQGRFQHRWKPTGAAIDDRMGDILTYRAISLASAGMAQLSGVEPIPAAQPDSMPSAPSSSGRP
jgi:hypothetical protein